VAAALVAASCWPGALSLVVGRLSPGAAAASGFAAPNLDHLRKSVVRIQSVSADFDWLRPWAPGTSTASIGSGFAVQARPYPLFVTNAHVVSDAKEVSLQLPLYGAKLWDAQVVSICSEFDVALLTLREPANFTTTLATRGIDLEPLSLSENVSAVDDEVFALGFPLGVDTLQLSTGNVTGSAQVFGNIAIQLNAPIFPGNSGGPLLDVLGQEVVGVNFAVAAHSEVVSFAIPIWRVRQLLAKHFRDQVNLNLDRDWWRVQVRVPDLEVTSIQPTPPFYESSGGCTTGLYMSRIGERSPLRRSDPPVQDGSFLVAVNGNEVNSAGMGGDPRYMPGDVTFKDLFSMVPDLAVDVEVTTCRNGIVSTHWVSMAWTQDSARTRRHRRAAHRGHGGEVRDVRRHRGHGYDRQPCA